MNERTVTAPIAGGAQTFTQALRALDLEGIKLRDVGLRRPTLDDVFLALTGRVAEAQTEKTTHYEPKSTMQEVA